MSLPVLRAAVVILSVEVGGMIIPVDNQQESTETLELLDKLPE